MDRLTVRCALIALGLVIAFAWQQLFTLDANVAWRDDRRAALVSTFPGGTWDGNRYVRCEPLPGFVWGRQARYLIDGRVQDTNVSCWDVPRKRETQ